MKQLADLNHLLTTRATVSALVLIGFGVFSVQLASDWQSTQRSSSHTTTSHAQPRLSNHIDVMQLTAAQFFGATITAAEATVKSVTKAPETRLKLELQGAFSSSVVEDGRALIAERGKKANYYRVGDSVPGGATLHRVAAEHVVLSRAGHLETLSFASVKNKPNKVQTDVAANRAVASATGGRLNHGSEQAMTDDRNTQQTASIKERLKRLREAQTRSEL